MRQKQVKALLTLLLADDPLMSKHRRLSFWAINMTKPFSDTSVRIQREEDKLYLFRGTNKNRHRQQMTSAVI